MRALTPDASGQLAIDSNALSSLRAQARSAPAEAVGKAASQFEALFVQMLMKQMRDALPQDGPLSSDTTKSYTAMFDQQVAQQLANRGIGLRKVIEQQLARQIGGATTPGDAGGAAKALKVDATQAPATTSLPAAPGPPGASGASATPRSTSLLPASVDAFIEKMRPHAEAVAQAVGIPVQYLLAQAGLETGWGRSMPRTATGESSHNLFGIKAGAQWKGAVSQAATSEVVAGQSVKSVERFRAYGSFTQAFQDFAALLHDSARYAGVMTKIGDARAYAEGLQRAGYATDPNYAAKLARSIDLVSRKLGAASAPVQVGAKPADKPETAG
ncbi:MAG TPA: flagellar assembly peptidoglycan hydrolase FlgJ [Burkholderiales bacterium]|nr:flagellar assembly peptidoglycan hydrolase FlgJ [Burkholderiales bacterium]